MMWLVTSRRLVDCENRWLDRYERSGVKFVFDPSKRELHYEGAAWREVVRRYPQSAEASEARKRLETQTAPSK